MDPSLIPTEPLMIQFLTSSFLKNNRDYEDCISLELIKYKGFQVLRQIMCIKQVLCFFFKKKALYLSVNVFSTKVLIGTLS